MGAIRVRGEDGENAAFIVSAVESKIAGEQVRLYPVAWRSIGLITLGAVLLYVVMRLLPTGTNLDHADFVAGAGAIEMCDPANPQFMPVMAVRSPVTVSLSVEGVAKAGQPVIATMQLKTASGKPIGPNDLLLSHTQKLHLMIVDPTLSDYQHIHPVFVVGSATGADVSGGWQFSFTPKHGGTYRIFCDFVPAATARGLYASVDLAVDGELGQGSTSDERKVSNYEFDLNEAGKGSLASHTLRTRESTTLVFSLKRSDGGMVELRPVMDAYAHLVAFDTARSGMAHLHPLEIDLSVPPDGRSPALTFKVMFPQPGNYVIWAQVNIAGREIFIPFHATVE